MVMIWTNLGRRRRGMIGGGGLGGLLLSFALTRLLRRRAGRRGY